MSDDETPKIFSIIPKLVQKDVKKILESKDNFLDELKNSDYTDYMFIGIRRVDNKRIYWMGSLDYYLMDLLMDDFKLQLQDMVFEEKFGKGE